VSMPVCIRIVFKLSCFCSLFTLQAARVANKGVYISLTSDITHMQHRSVQILGVQQQFLEADHRRSQSSSKTARSRTRFRDIPRLSRPQHQGRSSPVAGAV